MSASIFIMPVPREEMLYSGRIGSIVFLCLQLSGCSVGPDFDSPKAPQTQFYTESSLPAETVSIGDKEGERAQAFLMGQEINKQWWSLFQCKALDGLIKQGLAHSPNLHAARAALTQAQENLNAETGLLAPSVDARGAFNRQKTVGATQGLTNARPHIFNLYNTSINVSYTLDLFGGLRRQIEALEAQVNYQNFELAAAYLTLTANIVTTAINEASLRAQIEATKEIIILQQKEHAIIKAQYTLGGVSQADVLAHEALVTQTQAALPPLEKNLAKSRHALYALVGALPSEGNMPAFNLKDIKLPTKLPVTLPSALVRQRPDIKASEALLHQASAHIGVARASLFPQLTLAGSIGSVAEKSHTLFGASSNVWSLGAQLLQPLFRGGALIAKDNAAVANYEQAFAYYRQTVLQAFQNVADALCTLVEDARALQALTKAEKTARRSLELTQKQFQLGAVSFPALLLAERLHHQARIGRIQAEAARYADTAALFQTLGGGWWKNGWGMEKARTQASMHKEGEPNNGR
jgi:NodT family efflux transporter outer membrane factor (OMF) lipoprotein